mgnify:CR=1 FL=1
MKSNRTVKSIIIIEIVLILIVISLFFLLLKSTTEYVKVPNGLGIEYSKQQNVNGLYVAGEDYVKTPSAKLK